MVTSSAPPGATADPKAQLHNLGELVFGQSWLSGSTADWPDRAGELGRRTGLCAGAWAKNPRTPITTVDVAKANVDVKGAPRAVCIVGGSLKLSIVAGALQQAVTDGISDPHLAGEASAVVGEPATKGLSGKVAAFTNACELSDAALVPAKPSACQPAAKALVPTLDAYEKLEAEWATAVS